MKREILIAIGITILFLGLAIQPSVAISKDRINHPPGPPLLEGPRRVKPGTYNWTFMAIDPNKDDLYYQIGWGDGTSEDWIGPFTSGEKIKVNHTYYDAGSVCIRARAKDIYDAIGEWSEFDIEISIEPKDYLFQTIIDIANNPDVKNLLEQYKPDLFKVDIDRSVYRKLFFRNPRLMFDIIFTKPSISVEYLNKCYNNGIGITNILGEDKVIEIIENVEVIDIKLFDELNDIISKDEELSGRFETLKEMNKELDYGHYPILCGILILVSLVVLIPSTILGVFIINSLIYFGNILYLLGIYELFDKMAMLWLYYGIIFVGIFFTLYFNLCYIY